MHIGQKCSDYQCNSALIDQWKIKEEKDDVTGCLVRHEIFTPSVPVKTVTSKTYLGNIISSDGSNTLNILERKKKEERQFQV